MGEDHGIVIRMFENKYGGNEPFKGRFNREPRYTNANFLKNV